jgi:1-acyl-sn-glycerol-3-phosphate acyltransferase
MLPWRANVASRDGFDSRFDREWVESQAQSALGRAVTSLPVKWFHAKLDGADRIPAQGAALLVGNHSFLGLDGFVLAALVNREVGRYLRFLGERHLWDIPALGPILTRLGAVAGEPEAAVAMLEAGDLVAVYPGGIDDSWKPKAERYRLQWGQRAGFARVAMRARVPIVPVAGLGIDDAYDVVGRERRIGRALFGSPRYDLPIAFGALGTLLPRRVPQRYVVLPPVDTQGDPARADDVERVRRATYESLDAVLAGARAAR